MEVDGVPRTPDASPIKGAGRERVSETSYTPVKASPPRTGSNSVPSSQSPPSQQQRLFSAEMSEAAANADYGTAATEFAGQCSFRARENEKLLNDPVHGYIHLPRYCVEVVDTVEFQRTRDLAQLGTSYFVYPGASHRRFEHSIGVCHLAGEMGDHLQRGCIGTEYAVSEREMELLRVAALCHDLGHGPFSHVFEHFVRHYANVPEQLRVSWDHEDMSCSVLEHLIDSNSLEYDRSEIRLMQSLIRGHPCSGSGGKWIFDIVHNKRNGVDVDKFDYVLRDSFNLGIKTTCDVQRLVQYSRVVEDEVCFYRKEAFNLYELFHTRYSLFKQAYCHRVGKAIEYMIVDALALADPYIHLSECLTDTARFCQLTDTILRSIECSCDPVSNLLAI